MKISDIRQLSESELETKVIDIGEDLFKLNFQHGIRQLENTAKLKELRKDIARVKTVISQNKLNAGSN